MQDPFENIQDQEKVAGLIAKHIRGELSDMEKGELEAWVAAEPWHRSYFEQCTSQGYLDRLMGEYHQAAGMEGDLRAAVGLRIGQPTDREVPEIPAAHSIPFLRASWFRVAAAIFLLLGTGVWFWYKGSVHHTEMAGIEVGPILPGHQGAILTLADGKQLNLDSLSNGIVVNQNGAQASVTDSQLAYHPMVQATTATTYNTITTPRGRQYQLELPDGTKVWLNAASRITFPTAFTGSERKVTISGEGYFEVARNADKPFKVSAASADIEVLGTSFNISAYSDEGYVKATLLEGGVRVSGEGSRDNRLRAGVVLKPGDQAVVNENVNDRVNDQLRVYSKVDIEQVIAWKNGLFYFNSTDIATVMQQLSRWYDIDVRYEGKVPDIRVTGKMDKGLNLNDILDFLTKMEVKCRLLGRTVVISNN